MSKKKTIQVPNFKESGIGFTTTPTCIMENPHKWGLCRNSFFLWAYLISRIKKEQYFNGRTIKTQLQGNMGQTAVSKALQRLCELGFCTKRPNRNPEGQLAGYSYTFYAFPKSKAQVAKVDPKVCEKLEVIGWFDHPCDGNPSHGGAPHHGNPYYGEAPSKGKDANKVKDKNKEKTPSPLSEKEGRPISSSREDYGCSEPPEVEVSVGEERSEVPPPGRWYLKLSKSDLGARFLKALRPAQIPDDKALRSMGTRIEKGQITPAYLSFIEEKLIHPNQQAHDTEGAPLYSLPEILDKLKKEAHSISGESFTLWKSMRLKDLKNWWKEGNQDLDREVFEKNLNDLAAEIFPDEYRFDPTELRPDENCHPHKLLVYLQRCQSSEHLRGYNINDLIQVFHDNSIWTHLLDQAATGRKQFMSLEKLCHALSEKLPTKVLSDMKDLHANYSVYNRKKTAELEEKFFEMGAKPPAIKPTD